MVQEVRRQLTFDLREVNIDDDPILSKRHRYDVPLILVNGSPVFRHRVDAETFATHLLQVGGTPVAP